MSFLLTVLTVINRILWNGPLLFLLLFTHLFFTVRLRLVQRHTLRTMFHSSEKKKGGLRSLATSLAATLGVGNIVGVSSAVALGGPGAVFWCWLTGLLGMATAYAESYLCVKYRRKNSKGQYVGGMMYVLEHVSKKKLFGKLFAVLLLLSSFLVGCQTQAGTVTETVTSLFHCPKVLSAIVLVFFVGYVILHGSSAIMKLCAKLVPVMATLYFVSCILILILNHSTLWSAISLIFSAAFTKKAALSGAVGGSLLLAARYGIARGLFTNEAGIGTAPLAFVSDKTTTPERSACLSMTAVFFDTVILCALTGIVIVSSLLRSPALALGYTSTTLTTAAFTLLPFGKELLSLSLIAFAYATLVGWSYFGEQAVLYLFDEHSLRTYRLCYLFMIFLGSLLSLPLAFHLTDLINACLVVPNVLALFLLRADIKPPRYK